MGIQLVNKFEKSFHRLVSSLVPKIFTADMVISFIMVYVETLKKSIVGGIFFSDFFLGTFTFGL